MTLPDVALNDPHVAAHNDEREAINKLQDLSDPTFQANLLASTAASIKPGETNPQAAVDARVAAGALPKWKASTTYALGQVVQAPDGTIVRALVAHTSGGVYDPSKWTSVRTQLGSKVIRDMVGAPVASGDDAVTLTASTTTPSLYSKTMRFASGNTNHWTGFRCSGAPLVNNSSTTTALPRGATKTNASTNYWGGCSRVEFDIYDDGFAWTIQAIASSAYIKIWVNGKPHASAMQAVTSISGAAAGSTNHIAVSFPSVAWRRITLEWTMLSASPAITQGIRIKPTATVVPPSIPSPRFMVIGDSYPYGIGSQANWAEANANAWSILLGRMLGFADIWNFTAVPSTGVLKADTPNNYGAFSTRFDTDVIPYLRPGDVLLYCGSVNDGAEAAGAAQTQAIADLTYLMATLPGVTIIVSSPQYTATPLASHLRIRDEMQAAAAAVGLGFVSVMDSTLALFTGTGYLGTKKSFTDGVLNSTTTLTSATANFVAGDVGHVVVGAGIPVGTTIASVTNSTTAVMSQAASASASAVSVTITNGANDGNSDLMSEYFNGIHPSLAGARALALIAAKQIAPLLGQTT